VIEKKACTAASDIWSFGVTLIALYDGVTPRASLSAKEAMAAIVSLAAPRCVIVRATLVC
jgi:hypothetical protein